LSQEFLQVYEEHVGRVYAYFVYRLRSRADAEDLTQLTFERAFDAWGRFDPSRGEVATWLIAIARNALVDHHRRDRSGIQASISAGEVREAELPKTAGPDSDLGLSPELAAALDRLGRRERGLIALRFGADLRGPEIAELLDMSLANVHQILSRALRKLRRALDGEESETRRSASGRGRRVAPADRAQ
jgi:RNA polymerase sigma-70 factor (ECF subfamily)